MNSKLNAKNLPCLFNFFANSYPESKLAQCEVKEDQKWQHASANVAIKRITEIAKYFPELFLLLNSLENYSLCEKHYNQVIAKNFFIKQLKANNLIFSNSEEEFQTLDLFEKKFFDFEVQVSLSDLAYESLLKRIDELENLNKQLLFENKMLKKRVNKRFTDQQDRIVSAINMVASAIKYSLSRSKMIIDIDNHFISSGSYTKFINWLESLAKEQLPLPKGLLFLTFDNEQKDQKNYLDRGHNTVIFHTVTSFVAFNYDQNNNIQITDPWLYSELTQKKYEELFYLTSGMENEIHKELTNYLSIILEELCIEKNQEENMIDELVHNQSQTRYKKKCSVCQTFNIDNKKRVCPTCRNKLPTLIEINKQSNELLKIINNTEKSLIIHPYTFKGSSKPRSVPESEDTSQIFVPNLVGINPNSIANVQKVLEHIEEISGIKDGSCK